MKTRFTNDEKSIRGFIGYSQSGQYHIAHPNVDAKRWEVWTCDVYRAMDLVFTGNPAEFDEWSADRDICWVDQGNGVFLYSQDMES